MGEGKCYFLEEDGRNCLVYEEITKRLGILNNISDSQCRLFPFAGFEFSEKIFGNYLLGKNCCFYCESRKSAKRIITSIKGQMHGLIKKIEEKESSETNVS